MHILYGLIGCILSILVIIYRFQIRQFTGQIGFAEKYLGSGGTYTFFILVGIFGFFFSLMIMTDTLGFLFGGIGNQFFGNVN